jgi:hypothetical protein
MQRIRSLVSALAVVTLVTGCGLRVAGSSSVSAPISAQETQAAPVASASSVPTAHLKLAGTITESADSTAIAVTWRVGPCPFTGFRELA